MADDSEIRQLTSDSQARIAQDLVALRTLMQGLSQTQAVIERCGM
jgi:hypothetical protein